MIKKYISELFKMKILLIALLGGYIGNLSNVQGGVILGSMLAVGTVKLADLTNIVAIPQRYSGYIQIFTGVYLGLKFDYHNIMSLNTLLPAFLGTLCIFCMSIFSTIVLNKKFKIDKKTGWLSCSAGRMQDMIILAFEMNSNVVRVAISHTIRLLLVIIITPIILSIINR